MTQDRRAMVVVCCAALLAYAAALAGVFVYDDIHSIASNTALRELGNIPGFFTDPSAFSSTGNRMYRPVLLTTFTVDWWLGGGSVFAFKLGNVLVHTAVTGMLFALLRRFGARTVPAALAAGWFAVHPLVSEATNLVSARSELLLVAGLLIGLLGHSALLAGRRLGACWLGLGAVVAMGSKETGVMLAPLLLVAEYLDGRRRGWRWLREGGWLRRLLPVLALTIGYLVARKLLLGQATATLLGRTGGDPLSGHGRDLLTQLATMGVVLPTALLQMLVPWRLSIEPPVVFRSSFDLSSLAGYALLGVLLWLALRRRRRLPVLGIALMALCALPWIVIPLNVPLSEHRLYGPLCGAAFVLARLLAVPLRNLRWRPLHRALAAAPLLLFAVLSTLRCFDYRDEGVLWARELERNPHCYRAHWSLGLVYTQRGELDAACRHLAMATFVYPQNVSARLQWLEDMLRLPDERQDPGLLLAVAGELRALRETDPYVRTLQANAEIQAGRLGLGAHWFATAERTALSCLEIATPKGLVYRIAARARAESGDLPGAIALLDTGVARGLRHFTVLLDRAELLRRAGRLDEARADLRAALADAPDEPAVRLAIAQFAAPPR